MKKVLGYILSCVGIVGLLLTFETIRNAVNLSFTNSIAEGTLTIVSLALVAFGVFILYTNRKPKITEVPIYHGKEVVGFRRVNH